MDIEINYDLDTLLGSVAFDYKLSLGPDATGDTKMDVGDVVSGSAYYYFIDDDGVKRMRSGRYYFNTGVPQSVAVFSSSDFSVAGVSVGSGGSPISLGYYSNNGGVYISSGGVWDYEISLDNYSPRRNEVCGVTFGTNFPTYRSDIAQGFSGVVGATGGNAPAYTTSQRLHDANNNIPYLPISGDNLSYNDIRLLLLEAYNEQNPDETLSINDLPEFDEQDNTEPSYDLQPFSIDYDEILGEKEMESIIAETRYVLDTTPYEIESVDYSQLVSEPYAELKKNAVLDADTKTAISKIYDVAVAMAENDFLSLYAFGAILSIVMWFVFRR